MADELTPKDDGGAAFTRLRVANGEIEVSGGLSLRDYFAAHAPRSPMSALFTDDEAQIAAVAAYRYADAMLKERSK